MPLLKTIYYANCTMMRRLLMLGLVLTSMMAIVGCASQVPVPAPPQAKLPAPPAWIMLPPSNSLQLLDKLFSISEPELSPTKLP